MRSLLLGSFTLAAASAVAAPPAPREYTLYKLEEGNSFGARCLDGSPGAFYFSEAPGGSDDWVIYFQGGGWCYSVGDCYGRSLHSPLGSSKTLAPTAGGMGGLMSFNASVSPLATYNSVWLVYCDGNSFSGTRPEPVMFNNGTAEVPLYFRGRAIIDGVFDALKRNVMGSSHSIANARNIVETGCSAGGLATYLHADYVESQLAHSGSYSSIPISGYFLDHASVTGEFVYSEQIKVIHELSVASTNAACEAAHAKTQDVWRCNMAEHVYPFIQANVFILNSVYDSWQTGCIMTAEPVVLPNNTRANGNCSAAPGWKSCASSPASCTVDQITTGYVPFGGAMTNSVAATNSIKSRAPGNGGFLTSCHTHCEAQGSNFLTFAIDGVSMGDSVRAWLAANAAAGGAAPSAANWHNDCVYRTTGTHQCNPTCGALSGVAMEGGAWW